MDKVKFVETMAGMQEIFTPEKRVSKEKMEIYWKMFKDWEDKDFINACLKVAETKKISTFPLPAEIQESLSGDNALIAWLEVRKAIGRYGHGVSVQFPDPIIHSVIEDMGGWPAICSEPQTTWKAKEFKELYAVRKLKHTHPEKLLGVDEKSHIAYGKEYLDTVKIEGTPVKKEIE